MELTVEELIEHLKQDKLLPEQVRTIRSGSDNKKLIELIDILEVKRLAKYVEIFESGYTRCQVLPKEIIKFVNLKVLNLQNAKNIHTILPEIGKLKSLRVLSITNCALMELPREIGQLESLEELNVSYNRLITLPPEICNLRKLKVLNAACNPLQYLPDEIGMIRSLETLDFNFSSDLPIPQTFLLMRDCKVNSGRLTAPYFAFEAKEMRKEAAKYVIASKVMAQGARTMSEVAAKDVFAIPELRSHIASFVGWHPSFNAGQFNAGFANRFEVHQQQRTTAISAYDFLTKIIQCPRF